MKWHKWHAAVVGAVLVVGSFVLLQRCGNGQPPADDGPVVEAPAAIPADLLADVYVSTPNASWARLQRGIGGAVGILPATLPGVVLALTDLDVTLANELDGSAPMYGALTGDPTQPAFVFAMKLADPRRARGLLADGDTARFTAKAAPGMTILVPKQAEDRRFEIAVTNNGYLLMSRSAADLARLGPYVTRTLPLRPLPAGAVTVDLGHTALKTAIVPRLESLWREGKAYLLAQDERMRAERGRAPDFGDPAAIVAAFDGVVSRRFAILGDVDRLSVALEVTDDAAVLSLSLTPGKANPENGGGPSRAWIDGMKVGDAAPVLAMPAASLVAISMRDGEAQRSDQSQELETAIRTAVGARLQQPEKLRDAIDAVTKVRDETFALALGLEEPSGILLAAGSRGAEAANSSALRGVLDLVRGEPFKALFHVRDVKTASEDLPGLGKANVMTLVRDPPRQPDGSGRPRGREDAGARARPPAEIGAAWLTREEGVSRTVLLGAGAEPLVTLRVGAKPDRTLRSEPALKRFTTAIGNDATTLIVAQPLRLDPARANLPTAPLSIAVGKKGSDAFVRIDIADVLLREAARWQMGF